MCGAISGYPLCLGTAAFAFEGGRVRASFFSQWDGLDCNGKKCSSRTSREHPSILCAMRRTAGVCLAGIGLVLPMYEGTEPALRKQFKGTLTWIMVGMPPGETLARVEPCFIQLQRIAHTTHA